MEKILIIDDDKNIQSLLSDIVALEGYEPLVADNGKKALKSVKTHLPDLVLLDIKLPKMDGMEVLKEIKKIDNTLMVIILTGYGEIKDAVQATKLGAFNYITKPVRSKEITAIIKEALEIRRQSSATDITPREREMLNWLRKGKSSGEIAGLLKISERTVNFHINNILQKLKAASRTHAVALAIEKGIINIE